MQLKILDCHRRLPNSLIGVAAIPGGLVTSEEVVPCCWPSSAQGGPMSFASDMGCFTACPELLSGEDINPRREPASSDWRRRPSLPPLAAPLFDDHALSFWMSVHR
jgi:hypothetical protein